MSEKKQAIKKLLNEDVGVAEFLGGQRGSSADVTADQLTKISDALCSVSKKEVREDLSQEFNEKLKNVATKDDIKEITRTLIDHGGRIKNLEDLRADIKNVIDLAAGFMRWKEKAYKLCALGFIIMVAKAIGVPELAIKIMIALGGGI